MCFPTGDFLLWRHFVWNFAEQVYFGIPRQNQHFPQEMVDLCLHWSGEGTDSRWHKEGFQCQPVHGTESPSHCCPGLQMFSFKTQRKEREKRPHAWTWAAFLRKLWNHLMWKQALQPDTWAKQTKWMIPDIPCPGKVDTVIYIIFIY